MNDRILKLQENLAGVRSRIATAAEKSGRKASDVTLLAVTKYVDAETAADLFHVGCTHLGESRPQGLWDKAEKLSKLEIQWHLIGHLQRNKAKRSIQYAYLTHSVDTLRLLGALEDHAREADRKIKLLLEVNVSGESAKHGFRPEEVVATFDFLSGAAHLEAQGLMCMASLEGDLDDARRQFGSLRDLRDTLRPLAPDNAKLTELSMGMSRDFEAAIEQGATIVRVGSILFEGLV